MYKNGIKTWGRLCSMPSPENAEVHGTQGYSAGEGMTYNGHPSGRDIGVKGSSAIGFLLLNKIRVSSIVIELL